MKAMELYERLGRLIEDRILDADAEVYITGAGGILRPIKAIDPINKRQELVDAPVTLAFGRIS